MRRAIVIPALFSAGLAVSPAHAADYRIALPESYQGDHQALREGLRQVFLALAPGESLTLDSGFHARRVATIAVPDEERYKRVRRKEKAFSAETARIADYLDTLSAQSDGPGARLNMPVYLGWLGAGRLDHGAETELLIIGSPLHEEAREPAFSMIGDDGSFLIPTDSHIPASLAQSVYGTAGQNDGLKNIRVHWCTAFPGAVTTNVEAALKRFWALYIAAQSGELVTWTSDFGVCLERFLARARNGAGPYTLEPKGPLAMTALKRGAVTEAEEKKKSSKVAARKPVKVNPRPKPVIEYNKFESLRHPELGLTVTTGTLYASSDEREKWSSKWCYIQKLVDGIRYQVDLGRASPPGTIKWTDFSEDQLKTYQLRAPDIADTRSLCFPGVTGS